MSTFGRSVLGTVGGSIQLTSDGRPEMKPGGVTLDWASVTAAAADVTYEDGVTVLAGEKAVRYGQSLAPIGVAEVQTVTITGSPTGGTFTLTLPAGSDTVTDPAQTTAAVAYNAAATAVEAALNALGRLSPDGATVSGSAGGPWTVTFARRLGNVPQLTSTNALTGGTSPAVAHATTTAGTGGGAAGLWGPYDSAASDGRQLTPGRGNVVLVNETVKQNDLHSDHPPVLTGGRVFKNRIIATNGTASLAAGPTFANLEAAMPRLSYCTD
jgi:hypothetical protein